MPFQTRVRICPLSMHWRNSEFSPIASPPNMEGRQAVSFWLSPNPAATSSTEVHGNSYATTLSTLRMHSPPPERGNLFYVKISLEAMWEDRFFYQSTTAAIDPFSSLPLSGYKFTNRS